MTWINLDNIDIIQFRKGYKPPEFHDIIKYSRDARFMYPRVIEPLSSSFQNKRELINFFNRYLYRFGLENNITDITRYSYMPGPGEIRPTHVVLRYDLFTGQVNDTKILKNDDTSPVSEQVVLKIVNSKYGYQEYRKQQKLHEVGYPTPKTFYYCNYFTDIQDIVKDTKGKIRTGEIDWLLSFLREIETGKRLFSDLKQIENNKRITLILNRLKNFVSQRDFSLFTKFLEDLENLNEGIYDGLEFKGFFFMDYISGSFSFEQILFDILGGKRLEKESGAFKILPFRPFFNAENIINDVIDLIMRLWDLGECHNDLKGEHLIYNFNKREWNVIDWGELVGGSKGRDLAILLADTNAFIEDRCKFNVMYSRKLPDKMDIMLKLKERILNNRDQFWDTFLKLFAERISSNVFRDAYKILKSRNLTFQALKLEPYF
ncbi:MAG: hypothetical protein ACTSVI_13505 [Promethearchaeota archaeon]